MLRDAAKCCDPPHHGLNRCKVLQTAADCFNHKVVVISHMLAPPNFLRLSMGGSSTALHVTEQCAELLARLEKELEAAAGGGLQASLAEAVDIRMAAEAVGGGADGAADPLQRSKGQPCRLLLRLWRLSQRRLRRHRLHPTRGLHCRCRHKTSAAAQLDGSVVQWPEGCTLTCIPA